MDWGCFGLATMEVVGGIVGGTVIILIVGAGLRIIGESIPDQWKGRIHEWLLNAYLICLLLLILAVIAAVIFDRYEAICK